jgi:cytochrome c biogenesis protein CcmG, thiol:disulfide interchange protein DsbE
LRKEAVGMSRLSGRVAVLVAGVFLVGVWAGVLRAAPGANDPERLAPDIKLPAANGTLVSLAEFKGKVVLVDFWASWCSPCRQSFPAINALFDDFHDRGLQVVAVNVDQERRDADAFLSGRPHTIDVVFDPAGKSAKAFDLQGMPTSYLIGRDGTIRFVHTGFNDKVLAAYRREISQLLEEPEGGRNR